MARYVLSCVLVHLLVLLAFHVDRSDGGAVINFSYSGSGPNSDDSYTSPISLNPPLIYFQRPMTTLYVSQVRNSFNSTFEYFVPYFRSEPTESSRSGAA